MSLRSTRAIAAILVILAGVSLSADRVRLLWSRDRQADAESVLAQTRELDQHVVVIEHAAFDGGRVNLVHREV